MDDDGQNEGLQGEQSVSDRGREQRNFAREARSEEETILNFALSTPISNRPLMSGTRNSG